MIDRELAANYMAHMEIDDPLAVAAIADLGELDFREIARWIRAALEQQDDVLYKAPQSLQRFVNEVQTIPVWYDRSVAEHGCRVFLRNSEQFLAAFAAGAIVEGFTTRISKSFAITGRIIGDGVRSLKQNLWHLLDIFLATT